MNNLNLNIHILYYGIITVATADTTNNNNSTNIPNPATSTVACSLTTMLNIL